MGLFGKVKSSFHASEVLKQLRESSYLSSHFNAEVWEIIADPIRDVYCAPIQFLNNQDINDAVDYVMDEVKLLDQAVIESVGKFLDSALKDTVTQKYVASSGATTRDLIMSFLFMILGTFPKPVVQSGVPIVVPCEMYQNPKACKEFFDMLSHYTLLGKDPERVARGVAACSIVFAQDMQSTYNTDRGEASF